MRSELAGRHVAGGADAPVGATSGILVTEQSSTLWETSQSR